MQIINFEAKIDKVALLAEGVDRNITNDFQESHSIRSPSSRRAWIEMFPPNTTVTPPFLVALLAEGVDRNHNSIQKGGE